VGSARRPSPGPTTTGEKRRKRPVAGPRQNLPSSTFLPSLDAAVSVTFRGADSRHFSSELRFTATKSVERSIDRGKSDAGSTKFLYRRCRLRASYGPVERSCWSGLSRVAGPTKRLAMARHRLRKWRLHRIDRQALRACKGGRTRSICGSNRLCPYPARSASRTIPRGRCAGAAVYRQCL